MPQDRYSFDVVVVGCGILGTMVAANLAKAGKGLKVVCFRLSDTDQPQAESLRNQGWLQSGSRYADHDLALALAMQEARDALLEEFAVQSLGSRNTYPSIIQIGEKDLAWFHEIARRFGLDVRPIEPEEAIKRIGRFCDPLGRWFETPERHLSFSFVMEEARRRAKLNGIEFREVKSVVVERDDGARRVRLIADGCIVEARAIVLTAGCGNIEFLKVLKPDHGYGIRQTPLLLLPGRPTIEVPVLHDRLHGCSVVAYEDSLRVEGGCMIIGTEVNCPVSSDCCAAERYIEPRDKQRVFDGLERLVDLKDEPRNYRMTAGWEPIPPAPKHHAEPHLFAPEDLGAQNVVAGFCGRATFVMHSAADIVAAVGDILMDNPAPQETPPGGDAVRRECDIGRPWIGPVRSHHEGTYKFSDDLPKKKETGS